MMTQTTVTEFKDLWQKLKVPPEADLLKALSSGLHISRPFQAHSLKHHTEGLKATEAESVIPKAPMGKKKGKKSNPKHRPVRITNVHLKGDIDLSRDYMPASR